MSIGMAVTLPDGALLVADGRRSYPLNPNTPPDDNAEKIEQVAPTVALIHFGVIEASEVAVDAVRQGLQGVSDADTFLENLVSSVEKAWRQFEERHSRVIDLSHPAMRVGLVAGGLIGEIPFIAGSLRGSDRTSSDTILTGPIAQAAVLGGEEQQAYEAFILLAVR